MVVDECLAGRSAIAIIEAMSRNSKKSMLRMILVPLLAVSVIISFGLHTVQVDHVHPGHQKQHAGGAERGLVEIDAYLHGTEHKFFLVLLLLAALTAWAFWYLVERCKARILGLLTTCLSFSLQAQHKGSRSKPALPVFYLVELFRKGVLHSKVF